MNSTKINLVESAYLFFIRVLSPTVLGVLIGVITGLVINILTNKELLEINFLSVISFSISVIPLLLMIHVRDDWEFKVRSKIEGGQTLINALKNSISPGIDRNNITFSGSFLAFAALIAFGIIKMSNDIAFEKKPISFPKTEQIQGEIKKLKEDTTQLKQQIRDIEKKFKDSFQPIKQRQLLPTYNVNEKKQKG